MFGYIYMIINLLNNKKYIGKRCWNNILTINNDNYLGSGKLLKQSIKKYGKSSFKKEILYICYSDEELNSKEINCIKENNAVYSNEFYNIHEGGKGGNTKKGYSYEEMLLFKNKIKESKLKKPFKHSEETKNKLRELMLSKENHMKLPKYRKMFSEMFKGDKNPNYGKKLSDEQKRKLIESHNGFFAYNKDKQMSEEQKLKISEKMKLQWQDETKRDKWIKSKVGLTKTDITKNKMSKSAYKRYNSIDFSEDIFIYKCDKNNNIIEVFDGINEYCKRYKTKTYRNLKYAIKNKTIFKKYYWQIKYKSPSTIETTSLNDGKE